MQSPGRGHSRCHGRDSPPGLAPEREISASEPTTAVEICQVTCRSLTEAGRSAGEPAPSRGAGSLRSDHQPVTIGGAEAVFQTVAPPLFAETWQ
jgi:hypothetical protein